MHVTSALQAFPGAGNPVNHIARQSCNMRRESYTCGAILMDLPWGRRESWCIQRGGAEIATACETQSPISPEDYKLPLHRSHDCVSSAPAKGKGSGCDQLISSFFLSGSFGQETCLPSPRTTQHTSALLSLQCMQILTHVRASRVLLVSLARHSGNHPLVSVANYYFSFLYVLLLVFQPKKKRERND